MGLGHAVLMAKDLVGDEPFAVILPDDVIDAPVPCLKQMIDVFERVQGSVLATQVVEGPAISSYGVLDGSPMKSNPRIIEARGMVEKPKMEDAPSKNAIIGRYLLTPAIFDMLETITPGAGGELQLTDGIKALLRTEKVYGYNFQGVRYDAGDKLGMLKATVDFALKRNDLGPAFREYLRSLDLGQSQPSERRSASNEKELAPVAKLV
jgi:UTP--glucose-1-phosphate uridylyltransferase